MEISNLTLYTFTVLLSSGAISVAAVVSSVNNGYYSVYYTLSVAGTYLMDIKV
jgi:hypothetical protein